MLGNTTDLHVRVWGEGEPVVLLHGSGVFNPGRTWEKQQPLSEHHQLIVPDRRGYGLSPASHYRDTEAEIRDVVTLLGQGAHLVGLSYGGILSMLVAARYPHLVKSLVVIEPPAVSVARGNPAVEAMIGGLAGLYGPEVTPEQYLRGFTKAVFGQSGDDDDRALPEKVRRAVIAQMNETPPPDIEIPLDMLGTLTMPKLVVSGAWHPAFDAIAEVIAQRMQARHEVITGQGHFLQQAGDVFNQLLWSLWHQPSGLD